MSADLQHFERLANQRHKKAVAKAPLLAAAGLVPREDPAALAERKAQITARSDAWWEKHDADRAATLAAQHVELGEEAEGVFAHCLRVTQGSLGHCYWDAVYGAAVRRRRQGLPALEETQRAPTPEEIEAGRDRVRRLIAAWATVPNDLPPEELRRRRDEAADADPVLHEWHQKLQAEREAAEAAKPRPCAPPPPQVALPGVE